MIYDADLKLVTSRLSELSIPYVLLGDEIRVDLSSPSRNLLVYNIKQRRFTLNFDNKMTHCHCSPSKFLMLLEATLKLKNRKETPYGPSL